MGGAVGVFDHSSGFQADDVGGAGWRWVVALGLEGVCSIDARVVDAYQGFAGLGVGDAGGLPGQELGSALSAWTIALVVMLMVSTLMNHCVAGNGCVVVRGVRCLERY